MFNLNFNWLYNVISHNSNVISHNSNLEEYTIEEVQKHNNSESAWIIIHNYVYDITQWGYDHPGGSDKIFEKTGCDVSKAFDIYHRHTAKRTINKILDGLRIGKIKSD